MKIELHEIAVTVRNNVSSAFGREDTSQYLGKNNENVLYTKNDESISAILAHGRQLPESQDRNASNFDTSIARNNGNNNNPIVNTISREGAINTPVPNATNKAINEKGDSPPIKTGSFANTASPSDAQSPLLISLLQNAVKVKMPYNLPENMPAPEATNEAKPQTPADLTDNGFYLPNGGGTCRCLYDRIVIKRKGAGQ